MKQFFYLSLVTLSLSIQSFAEEALLSGQITHGGYGAPVVKFTSINGEFGVLTGGQGGWIINHMFAIGGGGYGLATEHHPNAVPSSFPYAAGQMRANLGYGGAILSFIGMSDRLLHPTVDLLVGAGGITSDIADGPDYDDDEWDMKEPGQPEDRFFVAEPTVNAELNIVHFMRLNTGVSYRFVNGVDKWGFTDGDISGFSVSVMLMFGKF